MKKILSFLILFLLISQYHSHAQVVTKLVEQSDIVELTSPLSDISISTIEIPFLSALEIERLQLEDIIRKQNNEPYRFAATLPLSVSTDNGVFVTKGENLFWAASITVPRAKSISLNFDYLELPEEGELYIYSNNRQILTGPFTKDNFPQKVNVVSEILSGDGVFLFYSGKNKEEYQFDLSINSINAGYRFGPEIGTPQESSNSSGNSSSCNVDITDNEGDCFRAEQLAAVVLIQPVEFCSGSLINNTNDDYTPLILTAHHCVDDFDNADFNNTNVRFRYWQGNNYYVTYSGTDEEVALPDEDISVLELESSITHSAIFAGWDLSISPGVPASLPASTTILHHPMRDEMKITFDADPSTTNGPNDVNIPGIGFVAENTYFRSDYDGSDPDDFGITETGSSGSSYYATNHRIIGQLLGGNSNHAGCNDFTYYGSLAIGATPQGLLVRTIDPINSGLNTMTPTFTFTGNTTIPCSELEQDLSVPSLAMNDGTSYQYIWTANSNINVIGGGSDIQYSAINSRPSGSVDWVQCDIRTPATCGNDLVATRRIDLIWNPSIQLNAKTQTGANVGFNYYTCPSVTTSFYPEFSNFPTPPGTSFNWSLSGSASFTSFEGPNGNYIDISPSSFGNISVVLSAVNPEECIDGISKYFTINVQSGCLNSSNDKKVSDFTIYPNPNANGIVNFKLDKELIDDDARIHIVDLRGKVLQSMPMISANNQLELKNLDSGLYIIRFTNKNQSISKKLFYQKSTIRSVNY